MAAPVLPRSTPTAEGVDPGSVLAFVDAVERDRAGVHSLMVVRHGSVVAEGWWTPFAPDVRHLVHSVSKSFLSTAIGIAQAEGLLSVDEPIVDVLGIADTGAGGLAAAGAPREVLLRHLLSMSAGHDVDTMGAMRALPGEDWPRLFFASPLLFPPGEHFTYDGGCSYLLSAAITARTGMTVRDYLGPRLFEPLGLATPPWAASPAGLSLGSTGLSLLTEDIAVLAELYRRRGRWPDGHGGEVPLLPEAWVEEATRVHVVPGPNPMPDWELGYGYQFWRSQHGYRMDGAFGQYGLVVPEHDLVIAITAGASDNATILRLVWERLLPGIDRAPTASDDALTTRLAGLGLPGPAFLPKPPPVTAALNGRSIALPFTTLGVATATLTFSADGERTTLTTVGTDGTVERIEAARTEWLPGATAIWPHPELDGSRTGSRAGWVDERTFEVHEQCIESACRRIWRFELAGGGPGADGADVVGTGRAAPDLVRITVGLDPAFWWPRQERVRGRLGAPA